MSMSSETRPRAILYSAVILLWIIQLGLSYHVFSLPLVRAGDYRAYYQAAEHIVDGTKMYEGLYGNQTFLYPPFLAVILTPVAGTMTLAASMPVWYLLNVLLLFATIYSINRHIPNQRVRLVVWGLSALFAATFASLASGQATIIMFSSMALAWVAIKDQRPGLAGVLLIIGIWTKIYAIVALAYLGWKREWRAVRWALIAGVILGIGQLLVAGLDNFGHRHFAADARDRPTRGLRL
jgi:hypothetical protein